MIKYGGMKMELINNFMNNLTSDIRAHAFGLFKGLILLIIGWWLINRVSKLCLVFFRKTCVEMGITSFLDSLLKFSLRIILLICVLGCLGFDVTSMLTALGASFIAVGISLKESLSNFISGIVLVINKPIHVGDFIEFENFSGTVMKIEMLFTTLQTSEENKTVIIPNSKLVSNTVVRKSRYNISGLEFDYKLSSSILDKEVYKFLDKEILLNNDILQVPAPQIKIEKISESDSKLSISVWCQDQKNEKINDDIERITQRLSTKYNIHIEKIKPEKDNSLCT